MKNKLLKPALRSTGTAMPNTACLPSAFSRAGIVIGQPPYISRDHRKQLKMKDGKKEKDEWMKHNDEVYPPQLPNEEPRPAFVCHQLINVKYPPKKMWVVAVFIRGMSVDEALKQLASVRKKGAVIVTKAIEEAIEMAIRDHNVEFRSNLWVAESFCLPGIIINGIRRRAKGSISRIRYRYSNYYVRLEEGQPPDDYYGEQANWTGHQMFEDWMADIRKRRVINSL